MIRKILGVIFLISLLWVFFAILGGIVVATWGIAIIVSISSFYAIVAVLTYLGNFVFQKFIKHDSNTAVF